MKRRQGKGVYRVLEKIICIGMLLLMLILSACTFGSTDSQYEMSAADKKVLNYIQNYEYVEGDIITLKDMLEYNWKSGKWESFPSETEDGEEVQIVSFGIDEDNEIQFQLHEGDMEEGMLGDYYACVEGELVKNKTEFLELLDSMYIEYAVESGVAGN